MTAAIENSYQVTEYSVFVSVDKHAQKRT